jgi:hypothetical protein
LSDCGTVEWSSTDDASATPIRNGIHVANMARGCG